MNYEDNIGKQVHKDGSGKPFKSGLKVNTVKAVIDHPILDVPAYTFEEDDSYVECRRCDVLNTYTEAQKKIMRFLEEKPDSTIVTTVQVGVGKGKTRIPTEKVKRPTHEVLDLVYHEDEGNSVFEGSEQECQDFITEQGGATFMYEVKPIIKKL